MYSVVPITLSADFDGDQYTVKFTLIDALGRFPRDQEFHLLLKKHGLGKLVPALTYASPYAESEI